jgi:hypothetical protein
MTYSRPWMFAGLTFMTLGAGLLWLQEYQRAAWAEPPVKKPSAPDPFAWKNLFDGKSLNGWKVLQFGGDGKTSVEKGAIVMEMGSMMTGIRYAGKPPANNYELELDGMRLDGSDFFCTTTFPVGKEHCSFVVGGWGGSLVGLSSVDYQDASENETTSSMAFKNNRWYRVRIRVSDSAIETWIDGKKIVDLARKDRHFSTRIEVELCCPLGISTWATKGAVRNIRLRALKPEEIRAVGERKKTEDNDK